MTSKPGAMGQIIAHVVEESSVEKYRYNILL